MFRAVVVGVSTKLRGDTSRVKHFRSNLYIVNVKPLIPE